MNDTKDQKNYKKAGIRRRKKRNININAPKTKVKDWGFNKIILKIDRAIDLIYRSR